MFALLHVQCRHRQPQAHNHVNAPGLLHHDYVFHSKRNHAYGFAGSAPAYSNRPKIIDSFLVHSR
nr:MAG TPA: hypothetical protein [Caudoviricetes sp.]